MKISAQERLDGYFGSEPQAEIQLDDTPQWLDARSPARLAARYSISEAAVRSFHPDVREARDRAIRRGEMIVRPVLPIDLTEQTEPPRHLHLVPAIEDTPSAS